MLRRRLCPVLDTVVRGFYTYGGSLMKRGQLCQPRRGLSRRRPPVDGGPPTLCRRFRSPSVIKPADARNQRAGVRFDRKRVFAGRDLSVAFLAIVTVVPSGPFVLDFILKVRERNLKHT